jgi:hypothetical protein
MWIAWQVAPQNGAAFLSSFFGESPIDPDNPVLNELPYLRVTECAHALIFTGRHENPHIA